MNTSMACLKKTVRYLIENERDILKLFYLEKKLNEIPREKIQSKRIDNEGDNISTESEINKLLQKISYKLSLFVRFLSHTGCRISELTGITLGDIKEESDFYKITIIGKDNKERNLKVNKVLIDEIGNHFKGSKRLCWSLINLYYTRYVHTQRFID